MLKNGHNVKTTPAMLLFLQNITAMELKECFAAIEEGDTEYVTQFLKEVGNGSFDDESSPLLYTAARYGKSEIVELFLGKGAPVDFKQEDGETALMAASKEGHEEVVELLLQGGANPNSQRHGGQTALMFAAQKGHSGVASILLQCGAKVDLQDRDGWSALMFSAKEGHGTAIEVLLDWDADPNLQSVNWESAMSLALQQGDDHLNEEIRTKLNEKVCIHNVYCEFIMWSDSHSCSFTSFAYLHPLSLLGGESSWPY